MRKSQNAENGNGILDGANALVQTTQSINHKVTDPGRGRCKKPHRDNGYQRGVTRDLGDCRTGTEETNV